MLKMHKLLGSEHFERLGRDAEESIRKRVQWLAEGKGDRQGIHGDLCKDSLWLGCIALMLTKDDERARVHFRKAADYALEWLRAPGSVASPRVYDVNLEASERGTQVTAMHERKPSREPRKLSITSYVEILTTVVAFGDEAGKREVASFPEEGYRNSEEVVEPYFFTYMRAWRSWLLGDEAAANREATACLGIANKPWPNANLTALLAISAKDEAAFERGLEEGLKAHKRQYQRQPNDPRGLISAGGLALCRLALGRGLRVEDQPYLPVRLLPNYKPVVH
jgi:hypothetical protein